jgi:hypothetical protein
MRKEEAELPPPLSASTAETERDRRCSNRDVRRHEEQD